MKKETLIEIILGTIGGLVFAIGMCMCLISEWNTLTIGIIVAIIGFIILLAIIPVYKYSHPKKQKKTIDKKTVATWVIGIVGSLIMGFGMSRIMGENVDKADFIIGIAIGAIGLIICILNYPIYRYIKNR